MPDQCAGSTRPRCVFVYGTLRRGGSNDITRLHPAPRFIAMARVQGTLYGLGHYPGLQLGGVRWVLGEIYEVCPAIEAVLDGIEGLTDQIRPDDEYVKRDISVSVGHGTVDCFLYEINPAFLLGAPELPEGDWLRAMHL